MNVPPSPAAANSTAAVLVSKALAPTAYLTLERLHVQSARTHALLHAQGWICRNVGSDPARDIKVLAARGDAAYEPLPMCLFRVEEPSRQCHFGGERRAASEMDERPVVRSSEPAGRFGNLKRGMLRLCHRLEPCLSIEGPTRRVAGFTPLGRTI